MVRIAAVSDLHGLVSRFALLGRLLDKGIDTLLVAGDIGAAGNPADQQRSIRANFSALLKGRKRVRVLAIPGNDDWTIVETTLREFPEVNVPTDHPARLDVGLSIAGYPYVPVTPFSMKDYEKWDTAAEGPVTQSREEIRKVLIEQGINISGLRSDGNELYDYEFDPLDRLDNIAADMGRLAGLSDPEKTVYLIHCPPFGVLDTGISWQGPRSIGSRGIADFIQTHRPRMTIHGHSHEAVDWAGGCFRIRLGASEVLSVGPGNDPEVLNYVVLDLAAGLHTRHRLVA